MRARGADARAAAARALREGSANQRGRMGLYYGGAGATNNRFSEREVQLAVRQRLVHTLRARLGGRDWQALPRTMK